MQTTNTLEYLKSNQYPIVAAIVKASQGEPEILIKITGSEVAAFTLLKNAIKYGQHCRQFSPADFPIALGKDNKITKLSYRLAGLILEKFKTFSAIQCDLPGVDGLAEIAALSKKEKEELMKNYLLLFDKTPNSVISVTAPGALPVSSEPAKGVLHNDS